MKSLFGSPVCGNRSTQRSSKVKTDRAFKGTRQNVKMSRASTGSLLKRAAFGAGEPVVFTAIKTLNSDNIGVGQNIVFDHVEINQGNGYHPGHGLFIAPVSGIYMFTCTLLRQPSSSNLHAEIEHNGRLVARVHVSGGTMWDQGSQTVFIQVNAGEEVWVRNVDWVNQVWGAWYSSFSGYLLFPL